MITHGTTIGVAGSGGVASGEGRRSSGGGSGGVLALSELRGLRPERGDAPLDGTTVRGARVPSPRDPDRAITLAGVAGAETMSKSALDASPSSLLGLRQGYADAVGTLKQAPATFNLGELQTAYGLGAAPTW